MTPLERYESELRDRFPIGLVIYHAKFGYGYVARQERLSDGVIHCAFEGAGNRLLPISQIQPSSSMTTDLYRYFDTNGRLLYIGVSIHAAMRAVGHRSSQTWWPDVATITIERVPGDRKTALLAEREAIRQERPLHNKAHAAKS